jgi:hypothetical protein
MGRIHYRKTQLGHIKIAGIGGFHTLEEINVLDPSRLWIQGSHFFFDDKSKTLVIKENENSSAIFLKGGKVFPPSEFNKIVENIREADKRLKQIIQDAKDFKERKEFIIII